MEIKIEPYKCYKCRADIYPLERQRLGYPLREATCGGDPIGWACDDCDLQPSEVPDTVKTISRMLWVDHVNLSMKTLLDNLTIAPNLSDI